VKKIVRIRRDFSLIELRHGTLYLQIERIPKLNPEVNKSGNTVPDNIKKYKIRILKQE